MPKLKLSALCRIKDKTYWELFLLHVDDNNDHDGKMAKLLESLPYSTYA